MHAWFPRTCLPSNQLVTTVVMNCTDTSLSDMLCSYITPCLRIESLNTSRVNYRSGAGMRATRLTVRVLACVSHGEHTGRGVLQLAVVAIVSE